MHAQWDNLWLIWMWILGVAAGLAWLTALGSGLYYLFRGRKKESRYQTPASLLTCGLAVVVALIIGAIGTFVAFPFSGQYHRYVPKAGIVANIGNRFIGSDTQGGGTTQKFGETLPARGSSGI